MREGVSSHISLFADDVTLLRKIRNHKCCEELQNDIKKVYEWSKTWEIEFNAKNLLSIGNVKEWNETQVRTKYHINKKE